MVHKTINEKLMEQKLIKRMEEEVKGTWWDVACGVLFSLALVGFMGMVPYIVILVWGE
jgi:hypothetical protein